MAQLAKAKRAENVPVLSGHLVYFYTVPYNQIHLRLFYNIEKKTLFDESLTAIQQKALS